MILDFLEIGTSDFETLALDESKFGIIVEPIKMYLDNLPDRENLIKICAGVSEINRKTFIYFIDPLNIRKYDLPEWLRGCNSIDKPHPTALNILKEHNLLHLLEYYEIDLIKFKNIVEEYNISKIKYLKIDTEGHDYIILKNILSYLKRHREVSVDLISLEFNELTKNVTMQQITDMMNKNNFLFVDYFKTNLFYIYDKRGIL